MQHRSAIQLSAIAVILALCQQLLARNNAPRKPPSVSRAWSKHRLERPGAPDAPTATGPTYQSVEFDVETEPPGATFWVDTTSGGAACRTPCHGLQVQSNLLRFQPTESPEQPLAFTLSTFEKLEFRDLVLAPRLIKAETISERWQRPNVNYLRKIPFVGNLYEQFRKRFAEVDGEMFIPSVGDGATASVWSSKSGKLRFSSGDLIATSRGLPTTRRANIGPPEYSVNWEPQTGNAYVWTNKEIPVALDAVGHFTTIRWRELPMGRAGLGLLDRFQHRPRYSFVSITVRTMGAGQKVVESDRDNLRVATGLLAN
jgi:hypothetical protein